MTTTTPPGTGLERVLEIIEAVDAWLDATVDGRYQDQPLAQDWARVAKITEEAGEAIDRLIALTGQNPRKGICGTQDELLGELADTAMTAIFAIQHFTKDAPATWAALLAAMEKAAGRVPAGRETSGQMPYAAEGITGLYWDNLGSGGAS